ncbi:hypothetical protein AXG93_2175s1100 [Marchantia polymorpha subsp. ruderalis]|uniref:Uncharacterized protein n=1 Tax=Marchantia polymorpha subsp. ruderalis TaxID=1480154 RepID=A0A176W626_MARPO|nr:hypothetical protein AXG93_2175s1100 [Marchantia polymorpha subsp. ruderalis]
MDSRGAGFGVGVGGGGGIRRMSRSALHRKPLLERWGGVGERWASVRAVGCGRSSAETRERSRSYLQHGLMLSDNGTRFQDKMLSRLPEQERPDKSTIWDNAEVSRSQAPGPSPSPKAPSPRSALTALRPPPASKLDAHAATAMVSQQKTGSRAGAKLGRGSGFLRRRFVGIREGKRGRRRIKYNIAASARTCGGPNDNSRVSLMRSQGTVAVYGEWRSGTILTPTWIRLRAPERYTSHQNRTETRAHSTLLCSALSCGSAASSSVRLCVWLPLILRREVVDLASIVRSLDSSGE